MNAQSRKRPPPLARLRFTSLRVLRFGSRIFALLEYAWHLLFWSRLAAAIFERKPIRLPRHLLEKKGIRRGPPRVQVVGLPESKAFEEGFADIYGILFGNLQPAGMLSGLRHVRPAPAFRGIYLWDSAFIARVWQDWDPGVAVDALFSVLEVRDGRRLQHVVANFVQSAYTQPPLIAWSVVRVADSLSADLRRSVFMRVYPVIQAYHEWLNDNRRHNNGLYFWEHPYESGVENSPRFSNTDETSLQDTRKQAAPDFSAYVVMQCEAMEEMAAFLGREAEREAWRSRAAEIRRLINRYLWNSHDGLYYDLDMISGEPVASRTVASLIPLAAGVPDEDQLEKLVAWIERPDGFGSPMPIPSVACSDPAFERDMWRGPVWLNTAYLVVIGLLRYGRDMLAGRLAFRLCKFVYMVHHTERRVYEFYDPERLHTRELNRKKGNLFKAITLGIGPQTEFVGWTGLVNRMVVEVLFGIRKEDGQILLTPKFPLEAVGSTWNLKGLDGVSELNIQVLSNGDFQIGQEESDTRLSRGSSLVLPAKGTPLSEKEKP